MYYNIVRLFDNRNNKRIKKTIIMIELSEKCKVGIMPREECVLRSKDNLCDICPNFLKPKWVKVTECPVCLSKNIKWHLSATKECIDCKNVFRAEILTL